MNASLKKNAATGFKGFLLLVAMKTLDYAQIAVDDYRGNNPDVVAAADRLSATAEEIRTLRQQIGVATETTRDEVAHLRDFVLATMPAVESSEAKAVKIARLEGMLEARQASPLDALLLKLMAEGVE